MNLTRGFILSFFLFVALTGHSQTDDGLGNFTAEEIALKECSFDKGADAIVFFDKAISNYNDEYNLITTRKVRFKILKEKGIERGNIIIVYRSKDDFETIRGIKALVATPSENGGFKYSSLDNKSIFRRKLDDYFSEVTFALPNVKVGSIIEYEYESRMTHYGGLRDWDFQKEIPVVLSSYNLYIVPNAEFTYFIRKNNFMQVKVEPDNREGRVYFEMDNIPGLRDESYSTSYNDYLQRINFQLSAVSSGGSVTKYTTTWKQMTRELLEDKDFGAQLDKSLSGTSDLKIVWSKASNQFDKLKMIHHYVQENIAWNGIESKYATDGLKNLMEKKKGMSGDMNLLLVNLLRSVDIEAYPLLVSERSHGKVDSSYPRLAQFNKVVAYANVDGKKYVIDASDRITPTDMVSFELLNTIGFIVDKKNSGFVKIDDGGKKLSYVVNIKTEIEKSAAARSEASVEYYGYARVGKAEKYKRDRQGYIDAFTKNSPNLKLDSFAVNNLESDSLALNHHIVFHQELTKSGSYYLLNNNFFNEFAKSPFVSDHRFTDVDFGARYYFLLTNNIALPDNMVLESIPKNKRIGTPDNSLLVIREVQQDGNHLTVNFRIEFNNSEFSVDEYAAIKDFFKKMADTLDEPVVLKSK